MKKNYRNKDNRPQQETPHRMASAELEPNRASRGSVYLIYWLVFLVGFAGGFFLSFSLPFFLRIGAGVVVALLLAYTVRIAPQWERVVILRFGRFHKISGPGLFFCIPFVDHVSIHVDQRIMISSFSAEAALTADLVPVDVDAVLFWMVWDVKKACLEVENYPKAVLCSAQTALRDAIGVLSLADISLRRREIDRELKDHLAEKCEDWGITVMSVEIRNIVVPKELQDALSKEAQAECEKNARILLAEIEKDISAMYVEAAGVYDQNDKAMQLRALNLAYDAAKDGKGSLIVPSSLAEGFNINLAAK